MSPPNSTGNSKKSSSKKASHKPPSTGSSAKSAPAAAAAASKRSASAALGDDDSAAAAAAALSKRAKRSTSGKKSLREEELGVGGEIAEEDMLEGAEDPPVAEEDEEDEGDEGDGGLTRCVCGEDNEEMASGLMIQCDTCKCWQHGPCVGLWDEQECPNRYFCELCKPNLHGPGGLLRKVNRKSSAPARGRSPSAGLPSGGAAKHASATALPPAPSPTHPHPPTGSKPRESADAALVHAFLAHEPPALERERDRDRDRSPGTKPGGTAAAAGLAGGTTGTVSSHEPKKRSTMNSRDAAYDDAIALSILEAGSAAMRAKLERTSKGGAGGAGSGDEADEREEEVIEEIIIGPGRNRKKSAPAAPAAGGAPKGPSAKKGGASGSHKKGAKGKPSQARGRRSQSQSNPDADSPAPPDGAEIEPKLEGVEDANEAAEAPEPADAAPVRDAQGEELEGELDPSRKDRGHKPGEEEKKEDTAGENQPTEQTEELVTEEQVVDPEARSPSPHPSPSHHHGGTRAKHPNQYTYRPKNGQPAPSRATKSPVKRSQATGASAAGTEPNGRGGGAATGQSGSHSTGTFGWGMPEHLKHLAHLLPSQSPQPLIVTSAVDPTLPHVAEPSTKVRFPGKRVTMPEMRKRARTVLDFVTKVQVEMVERQRRWDLLRDVNTRVRDARERGHSGQNGTGAGAGSASESGSGAGSGSIASRDSSVAARPRGVGGTTPVPTALTSATTAAVPDLAFGALPPLPGTGSASTDGVELSSAPSAESVLLMDQLAREVVQFQQRFFNMTE